MSQLHVTDKLFGTTTLSDYKAVMAKKTYALLSISLLAACAGGYLGVQSPEVISFFSGYGGWILAMILINVIPRIALWASHQKSRPFALFMLGLDGFVSGLVLAPLLYYAQQIALANGDSEGQLVWAAMGITGAVFLAVTGYIFLARKRFSAPAGLLTGIFFVLVAATVLNMYIFPGLGVMGLAISVGIGIFGVLMLVYATSSVLNDPNFLDPFAGALMLFAALFNIFVSTLNILLRLFGNSRD